MKEFFVKNEIFEEFVGVCDWEKVAYTVVSQDDTGYTVQMDVSEETFDLLVEMAWCEIQTANKRTPYISPKIMMNPKALGSMRRRHGTRAGRMRKEDLEQMLGYKFDENT